MSRHSATPERDRGATDRSPDRSADRHSERGSERAAESERPEDGGGHATNGAKAGGEKRARILDAAVHVFAEKGFYNAKVSEIASLAGVADGTIYLYFKSKDDLLISLFEDRMEEVIANVRGALQAAGSPVERLRGMVRGHLDLVRQNPQLAEVLTVELRQSSKFLKEYKPVKFGEFLKLIAEPIEAGQRDGSIRAELDAPLVARAIFGALDELALAWVLDAPGAGSAGKGKGKPRASQAPSRKRASIDLSRAGDQLADLFIEGLLARPEGGATARRDAKDHSRETKRRTT